MIRFIDPAWWLPINGKAFNYEKGISAIWDESFEYLGIDVEKLRSRRGQQYGMSKGLLKESVLDAGERQGLPQLNSA
jgi:hypothetical protein